MFNIEYDIGIDCFNSRTREGCDFDLLIDESHSLVSIHAPARGAMFYCS